MNATHHRRTVPHPRPKSTRRAHLHHKRYERFWHYRVLQCLTMLVASKSAATTCLFRAEGALARWVSGAADAVAFKLSLAVHHLRMALHLLHAQEGKGHGAVLRSACSAALHPFKKTVVKKNKLCNAFCLSNFVGDDPAVSSDLRSDLPSRLLAAARPRPLVHAADDRLAHTAGASKDARLRHRARPTSPPPPH